jgi:hypothetical protein
VITVYQVVTHLVKEFGGLGEFTSIQIGVDGSKIYPIALLPNGVYDPRFLSYLETVGVKPPTQILYLDIENNPGENYRGWFGKAYDDALDQLLAESRNPLGDVPFSDMDKDQFFFTMSGIGFSINDMNAAYMSVWGELWIDIETDGALTLIQGDEDGCANETYLGEAKTPNQSLEFIRKIKEAFEVVG